MPFPEPRPIGFVRAGDDFEKDVSAIFVQPSVGSISQLTDTSDADARRHVEGVDDPGPAPRKSSEEGKPYHGLIAPKAVRKSNHDAAERRNQRLIDALDRQRSRDVLPADAEARKDRPMATGLLDYFPAALAEVARVSKAGNDQHNPGQPLHWARGKSTDHADCIVRHLVERDAFDDVDGMRHSAKLAWRALALLQEELEAEGAAPGKGSWF